MNSDMNMNLGRTHLPILQKTLRKLKQRPKELVDKQAEKRAAGERAADMNESADEATPFIAPAAPTLGLSEHEQTDALEKIQNGDFNKLTLDQQHFAEAVIEFEGRPVSFVRNGNFEDLPDQWQHFNSGPIRDRIESAIPLIGRIEIPAASGASRPRPLGTGFIVGRNLMMTNRHVAQLFCRGVGRTGLFFVPGLNPSMNTLRERGFDPSDRTGAHALLEVVMIHPYWDMALIRVDGFGSSTRPLTLSVRAPEDMIGAHIAVIGYPVRSRPNLRLDPDSFARAQEAELRYFGTGEDKVGVKRVAPGEIDGRLPISSFQQIVSAMAHDSSTLPGNSGAAVLDVKTGAVAGLHFGGITFKSNYAVPLFELARDRRVVDSGINFEGAVAPTNEWENFWKVADPEHEMGMSPVNVGGGFSPTEQSSGVPAKGPDATNTSGGRPGSAASVSVSAPALALPYPISINITIGGQALVVSQAAGQVSSSVAATETGLALEAFQIPIIHPDLESRDGYQPDFIGGNVPMPTLTAEGAKVAAQLLDGSGHILKYHHFSVIMHKKRRLALLTVANVNWQRSSREIDGKKPSRSELSGIPKGVLEEWAMDPRISEDHQLPDIFFTKDKGAFDKGHLVRRDDVAWCAATGDSEHDFADMQKANGDTYHTTNCSPQISRFNQGNKGDDGHNWGDLENMIQRQTSRERVSIFSGPALDPRDRIFKGVTEGGLLRVQIPRQFWKIVVANEGNSGLRAFGFILKQNLEDVPLEFAVPEDWEAFQAPVAEIEKLVFGLLDLSWFKEHDVLYR